MPQMTGKCRMALLKIARMGHPVLVRRAAEVDDLLHPEIRRLAEDMIETMHDAAGAGLAAPQVHRSLRLFVYHVPPSRVRDGGTPIAPSVLINPVLTVLSEEKMSCTEGCLSLPGLRGVVQRHAHIAYEGYDLDGMHVSGEARGFHANVLQHECDHLDGILYPMRITDFSTFGFQEELAQATGGRS